MTTNERRRLTTFSNTVFTAAVVHFILFILIPFCLPTNDAFLAAAAQSPPTGTSSSNPGKTCFHIHRGNRTLSSGLYWINPTGASNGQYQAFCDMSDRDSYGNAGYTVIQRRVSAAVDFNRNWAIGRRIRAVSVI